MGKQRQVGFCGLEVNVVYIVNSRQPGLGGETCLVGVERGRGGKVEGVERKGYNDVV